MADICVDLLCFAIEIMTDMVLLCGITQKHIKDMRHPAISLAIYFVLGFSTTMIFPNIFGWLLLCLLQFLAYRYIFKLPLFESFMAYCFQFMFITLVEEIILMAFEFFGRNDTKQISIAGSLTTLIIICIICRYVPLNHLFRELMKGRGTPRFIIIHLYVLYMIVLALTKYSSVDMTLYTPLIASFAVVIIISDIVLLGQQHLISKQENDLNSYKTYQPMMSGLLDDIRAKQHDFNNQLTSIRSLPLTHKDYESLANALLSNTDDIIAEYKDFELLKINLPVVAGFLYSKKQEAEKNRKHLNITVRNSHMKSAMPEYELIRIIGILTDNALEAVPTGRTVSLTIDSGNDKITLITENEGPELTPDLRAKLFTKGYTTKASDSVSHGLGLYSMKELVDRYGGKIYLENTHMSDKTLVRFEVVV